MTRDGRFSGLTRDGQVSWLTRDGQLSGLTRVGHLCTCALKSVEGQAHAEVLREWDVYLGILQGTKGWYFF